MRSRRVETSRLGSPDSRSAARRPPAASLAQAGCARPPSTAAQTASSVSREARAGSSRLW